MNARRYAILGVGLFDELPAGLSTDAHLLTFLPRQSGPSRTKRLGRFFAVHPLLWVDGSTLLFAGKYAWRSRVSDLRRSPYFMNIENRQRRMQNPDGTTYIVSEYRFVPEIRTESAQQAAGQGDLLQVL